MNQNNLYLDIQNEDNNNYTEEIEEEESEEENEEITEEEDETLHKNIFKEKEIINENIFVISLDLIQKFKEIKENDSYSDSLIIDYLSKKGLPMHFKNQKMLSLYLYFHKISSSFYILFAKISSKEIYKLILSLLKESYYILADEKIQHFNYNYISQKIFENLKLSEENSDISKIPIILKEEDISDNTKNLEMNKLILELGFQSHGRLDVYTKIHIIKSLVKNLNNKELLGYMKIFHQMENDLLNLYTNSQKEKLDSVIYEQMVNIFVNGEMQDKWDEYLNHCRKLIGIFQNVGDSKSLQILEKLFIQLLGHVDRRIRNYAVKILNMIYDGTIRIQP